MPNIARTDTAIADPRFFTNLSVPGPSFRQSLHPPVCDPEEVQESAHLKQ